MQLLERAVFVGFVEMLSKVFDSLVNLELIIKESVCLSKNPTWSGLLPLDPNFA